MKTFSIDHDHDTFNQWWHMPGEWVEEPNKRRGGESGVLKVTQEGRTLYIKRQLNHLYRDISHPFGQATIIREFKAYQALTKAGINIPKLVYCGTLDKKALLITEELKGFTDLDSWIISHRDSAFFDDAMPIILNNIANMLARFHLNRLQHGSLYGKHIFIKVTQNPTIEIESALLDLEKVKYRLSAKAAALHDVPKLKRHSELTPQQWQYFINAYEQTFKSKLPKLHAL